jgi:hypothetical protein
MFGRSWSGFGPYGGFGYGRSYLGAGIGYPYYGGLGGGCGYGGLGGYGYGNPYGGWGGYHPYY